MSVRSMAAVGAVAVLVFAGCASSSESTDGGPAPVSDGSYALLASSAGGSGSATLQISGEELTLADSGASITATLGEPAPEAVLCPPSEKGEPLRVAPALAVGGLQLSSPAIYGDCGETAPKRVTIIDLDSLDEAAGPLQYTRWVEFCDTSDPDCTSIP